MRRAPVLAGLKKSGRRSGSDDGSDRPPRLAVLQAVEPRFRTRRRRVCEEAPVAQGPRAVLAAAARNSHDCARGDELRHLNCQRVVVSKNLGATIRRETG